MAISRKRALKRIHSLLPGLKKHISLIAANPDDQAIDHHRQEARNWLNQMMEVLPHVGKKTATEWKERLKEFEAIVRS